SAADRQRVSARSPWGRGESVRLHRTRGKRGPPHACQDGGRQRQAPALPDARPRQIDRRERRPGDQSRRDPGCGRGYEDGERAARRTRWRGETDSRQARRQPGGRCDHHGIRLKLASRAGVMTFLAFPLSPFGRASPRAFAVAIGIVYLAGFASQVLLAAAVTTRAGLAPFVLVQSILLWVWFALHARRLRDCGCGVGWAIGIGLLYALGIALMVVLVELMVGTTTHNASGSEMTGATFLQLF